MSNTRNSQALNSFTEYCKAHPDERFWQALRNWSGYPFVVVAKSIDFNTMEFKETKDTFYWENLDNLR